VRALPCSSFDTDQAEPAHAWRRRRPQAWAKVDVRRPWRSSGASPRAASMAAAPAEPRRTRDPGELRHRDPHRARGWSRVQPRHLGGHSSALGSGGDDVVEAAPPCMAPGRGASRSRGGLGPAPARARSAIRRGASLFLSAADLRGLWRSPSWWSRRQEKQGRGVLLHVGGEEGAGGRVSKARRPLSQGSMSAASIPRSRRW
jgi:hypothetical protein